MAATYLNLKINGNIVKDVILQHISVTQSLNEHWWCHVECRHLQDQRRSQDAKTDDEPAITAEEWLGKNIQLIVEDKEEPLFDGFVHEVELIYELSGSFTVVIQGVTPSLKMDVTPRHAYYRELSLTQIAQQLAGRAGLSAKVECKDGRLLNYVQWGESDFQFLRRLADDHGCWMRPSPEGIEIYDTFQKGTTVNWRGESGEDALRSFSVKGTLAPPSFNGAHYDFHTMKSKAYDKVSEEPQFFESAGPLVDAVKQGSKENLPPDYLPHRSRIVSLDEYEQLLKKESVRSIGRSITGAGESINTELLPGDTVTIEGTLDSHGVYGVTHVAHHWDPSGYVNQFTCTPWKSYTDPHPQQFKPRSGVVPARVVEHNDPKKMGRIKVQYFWQEDSSAHWARMMTPHAGGQRGFMFMPEVGDEVVVIFEDGDPERPLILGCVWNGVDVAPRQEFWGDDIAANDVKRIVTKSGNRIQMVDKKGNESIVMSTPNSIRVALITNANETHRETLLLDTTDGDIILNAPNGRIHFHCKYFSREVG